VTGTVAPKGVAQPAPGMTSRPRWSTRPEKAA